MSTSESVRKYVLNIHCVLGTELRAVTWLKTDPIVQTGKLNLNRGCEDKLESQLS